MINNAMAKFADIVKGLYDTQYVISGKPPKQTDEAEEPRQAISLIDLDDGPSTTTSSPAPQSGAAKVNVLDELSDLFGTSASISTPPAQQQPAQQQLIDPLAFLTSSSPSPAQSTSSSLAINALPPPPAVSPTLSSSSIGTPSATFQLPQEPLPAPANNGNAITHDSSKLFLL